MWFHALTLFMLTSLWSNCKCCAAMQVLLQPIFFAQQCGLASLKQWDSTFDSNARWSDAKMLHVQNWFLHKSMIVMHNPVKLATVPFRQIAAWKDIMTTSSIGCLSMTTWTKPLLKQWNLFANKQNLHHNYKADQKQRPLSQTKTSQKLNIQLPWSFWCPRARWNCNIEPTRHASANSKGLYYEVVLRIHMHKMKVNKTRWNSITSHQSCSWFWSSQTCKHPAWCHNPQARQWPRGPASCKSRHHPNPQ